MFPNEIPGSCSRHFWRDQLGGEFHRYGQFSTTAEGGRSNRRLRFLRDSRCDLAPLCMTYRVRDQRQDIGTDEGCYGARTYFHARQPLADESLSQELR